MTPVLYSFRRCPYAMRARLAIQAAAQTVELREIELKAKPPEMLGVSPKGTVPVLVLQDTVLEQSLDIMLWALHCDDPLHWLPDSDAALHNALALIAENDGSFKHHLDRYKYPHRYSLENGWVHRQQGALFLQALEVQLQGKPFLAGLSWGLSDAAIAPFVRQFAHTDLPWFDAQAWLQLQQWLRNFEASVAFNNVMQKVPPWKAGAPALLTCFAA